MNDQSGAKCPAPRVRDACGADVDAIVAIWNEQIAGTTNTFKTTPIDETERRSWWQSHCEPGYPVWVAEADGNVVGWASLSPFDKYEGYRPTAEVSVFVRPQAHGCGVATLLYRQLVARADAIGHHTLIARIVVGNEASLRLHERFGFQRCGYLKEVGFKMDRWLDVVFMQRLHPDHRFGERQD